MKTIISLSVLLAAGLVAGCHSDQPADQSSDPKVTNDEISFAENSPQLASLEVAPVESHAPAHAQLPGRLIWDDDLTARIFTPFAGRVRKINADIGQTVDKSAPLAEVESPDFGQAQADARKADGDLKLAERNLARARELFDHGAAAQKDVDAAEDTQAQARAENSRAISKIQAYGASTDSPDEIFVLRSPLAGTVVDKSLSPGLEIRPDQMLANLVEITAPLFVVTDPSRLWIQIDATEVDVPRLQPGLPFTLTSRAFPGQTFTGRVDNVSEFIDPNTRTIKVRGNVDNSSHLLKAEMFVNVDLPDETVPALSVPATAVFLKGDKHFVFVQARPGQFTREEVAIGSEQAGRVLVLNGLQTGQLVVTDGCILLQQLLE